jgi:ankyrin repeat protein
LAVNSHNLEFVKYLTDSYSDALASMRSSDSKLYQNKLLKFLNGVDNKGNTPLCLASAGKEDGASVCEYLIEKNLEIIFPLKEENINAQRDGLRRLRMLFNHRNYDGDSPIALACAKGNLNCVKVWTSAFDYKSELKALSVEQYCDQIHDFISTKNRNGLTPLRLAQQNCYRRISSDIVKCLVEFYSTTLVSVNPADSKGNRDKLLALLYEADNRGNTPHCIASMECYGETCESEYLVSKHLQTLLPLEAENPDAYRDGLRRLFYHTNFDGDTPLALACARDRLDCIQLWITRYIDFIQYLKMTEDESKSQAVNRYLETTNKKGKSPMTLTKSCFKDWILRICKNYNN